MATKTRIYIEPTTGDKVKTLLVFDYVESLTASRSAKVLNHPVESINTSSADHRYREGVKIQLTAMVSNNWQTSAVLAPSPKFENSADKQANNLVKALGMVDPNDLDLTSLEKEAETSSNYYITSLVDGFGVGDKQKSYAYLRNAVTSLLNVKEVNSDLEEAVALFGGVYVSYAYQAIDVEDDILDTLNKKGLPNAGDSSNQAEDSGNITTQVQTLELIKHLDKYSDLMRMRTHLDEYENLAITNFTHTYRNGADRAGLWVSLTLEEQMTSKESVKVTALELAKTEVDAASKDIGKQNRKPITPNNKHYQQAKGIWDAVKAEYAKDLGADKVIAERKNKGVDLDDQAIKVLAEDLVNNSPVTVGTLREAQTKALTLLNKIRIGAFGDITNLEALL